MKSEINFYQGKVSLNVLAKDLENAKEIFDASDGHVLIGLLSANYDNDQEAIEDIKRYQETLNNAISIGLGAGSPEQSEMVKRISPEINPLHVNQVFTGLGSTVALNTDDVLVNALVSPTSEPGYVNIATGPKSSQKEEANIPIETAIAMIQDMGGHSLKFFPMNGLEEKEAYIKVAEACAENNMILEPTGGIDLENFEEIIRIALDAGVKKIIPHVYSSIIDPETNETRVADVKKLFEMIKWSVK